MELIVIAILANAIITENWAVGIFTAGTLFYSIYLSSKLNKKVQDEDKHTETHKALEDTLKTHENEITLNRHDVKNIQQQCKMEVEMQKETYDTVQQIKTATKLILDKLEIKSNIFFN